MYLDDGGGFTWNAGNGDMLLCGGDYLSWRVIDGPNRRLVRAEGIIMTSVPGSGSYLDNTTIT